MIIYQVSKQKNQGGYWKQNTRILLQDSDGSAISTNQSSSALHLQQSSVTPQSIWPPLYMTDDGSAEAKAMGKQVQL